MTTSAHIRFTSALLLLTLVLAAQPVTTPVIKTPIEPLYPDDLKYFFTDHLTVKLTIDDQGKPFAIESLSAIPDNVVKAIRASSFEPARKGKSPVAVAMSYMIPVRHPPSDAGGRTWASAKEITDADKIAKDLDDAGAAAAEVQIAKQIAQNPGDVQAHLVAARYWSLHDSPANDSHANDSHTSEAARLRQLRWFAEINPRYEFLGEPGAAPRREETGSEDYEALRKLWIRKLSETPANEPADKIILDNATNFLRISDPAETEKALLNAAKYSDYAVTLLGDLYAFSAMGAVAVDPYLNIPAERSEQLASGPFAVRARETLLKTENMRLLFSALRTVSGAGDAAFCAALLEHAKQFDAQATANCDAVAGKKSGGSVRVGGTVIQANLIRKTFPRYPEEAKSRHITGVVRFEATIGKDGKIHDLKLLSAPFALYDASREAVLKWEYKPTQLNGEPVSVLTTIDVNYDLRN